MPAPTRAGFGPGPASSDAEGSTAPGVRPRCPPRTFPRLQDPRSPPWRPRQAPSSSSASGRAGGAAPPARPPQRCAVFTPSEREDCVRLGRDSRQRTVWSRWDASTRTDLQIDHAASRGGVERRHRFLVRGRFEDEEDVVVARYPIAHDEGAAEMGDRAGLAASKRSAWRSDERAQPCAGRPR